MLKNILPQAVLSLLIAGTSWANGGASITGSCPVPQALTNPNLQWKYSPPDKNYLLAPLASGTSTYDPWWANMAYNNLTSDQEPSLDPLSPPTFSSLTFLTLHNKTYIQCQYTGTVVGTGPNTPTTSLIASTFITAPGAWACSSSGEQFTCTLKKYK